MMGKQFGHFAIGHATRDEALAMIMEATGDAGPVVHDDGAGRVWTGGFVYGVDEVQQRVTALPRNPPSQAGAEQ